MTESPDQTEMDGDLAGWRFCSRIDPGGPAPPPYPALSKRVKMAPDGLGEPYVLAGGDMSDVFKEFDGGHISEQLKGAFEYVRGASDDRVCLFDCRVNGEKAVAICAIQPAPGGEYALAPLFVSITPAMKLTDSSGLPPEPPGTHRGGEA